MNKPFTQIENEVLDKWDKDNTFQKSIDNRSEKDLYVFYDGPPFATGTPHYGHLVGSIMKDVVPRFWTMNGKRVERKWGWDCHGLPIENIVEKELKLNSRQEIEEYGVETFNNNCRTKVGLYADDWKVIIRRLARWVDMENDYKTMDLPFMESAWWVFKSLWDKDLIYEGHKAMHICPRCETTLSNQEVSQGYKDVKDLSVTAKFALRQAQGDNDEVPTYILAWTTTPWTLIGNVALAVGADLDYVIVKIDNEKVIINKELSEKVLEGKDFSIEKEIKGSDLVGKKYKPLFDYYLNEDVPNKENLYTIVDADFVSTEDGTGVVHLAPAFGEDDMRIGQEKDLSFIQHVGMDGKIKENNGEFSGMHVKPEGDVQKTDVEIIKFLAGKNLLFSKEKYEHSYPHCWRCETPLINYATSSWFIKVTAIKEQLLKNAKDVSWTPAYLKDGRFGQWLENARDWAISRSRYWGNTMPVWRCESCDEVRVFGSRSELAEASGQEVPDLHKHVVDKITIKCKCGDEMKRIPEVLDCWFESGSMPYGQMHYPFENKEKFEANFPAEFIAEGVDQTTSWFYVLHVLSTALFDKPAYKNVIANGIVLAEDGQKMSKRKQNYPDPTKIFEKYGADALRYYMLTSPVMRAEDLCFSEKGVDDVYKKVIIIMQNVLSFYQMFAEGNEVEVSADSINILDRWVIAKLNETHAEVDKYMRVYDLPRATKPLGEFITELSTWYVRRSRDRFKGDDSIDALSTLKHVLQKLSLIMAPFTPLMAEHLWLKLENEGSVHLQDWPKVEKVDAEVLKDMELVRQVVELGLSARDEKMIKVRQPLQSVEYKVKKFDSGLEQIIADELNVKEVQFTEEIKEQDDCVVKESSSIKVGLNITLTDELKQEGLLRELTRNVNSLRRKQGLTITDKVEFVYSTEGSELQKLFDNPKLIEQLKQNTLLSEVKKGEGENELKANDETIKVSLQ